MVNQEMWLSETKYKSLRIRIQYFRPNHLNVTYPYESKLERAPRDPGRLAIIMLYGISEACKRKTGWQAMPLIKGFIFISSC